MANVFDEMSNYWAEIADKNQIERQIQFLRNRLKADGYVLDLACGTGRHIIPLSQQGYGMVGLDVSRKLLKIAKQRFRKVEVVLGDMRYLPFKKESFAATVSMDTSFGYLPSEADDQASLVEVHRVLFERGVFVVDVFNREELSQEHKLKKGSFDWKEYPSFFLKQKRTVSTKGDWLCDSWTVRDKLRGQLRVFEHSVRLFGQERLLELLKKTCFFVEQVYGDYEEQDLSSFSKRLIFVAAAT
jgi:ubiquinone/menaquinone biosynthesis C-methylase UbiE